MKISIPTKAVLQGLLQRHTLASIGEMYGVTRQAVDLWRKRYGLASVYEVRPRKAAASHPCTGCEKSILVARLFCSKECRSEYLANNLEHGASRTYGYWGCRCAVCREGNAERMRASKAANALLKKLPKNIPHGRTTTYNYWGCRCDECKSAHSEHCKKTYQRRRQAALQD